MKTKLLGLTLFVLTMGAVVYYPSLSAKSIVEHVKIDVPHKVNNDKPIVDVVFVLDTTGSMSGLIDAAKEKIWSIATTMSAAQPTPEIRIGLV
ncbi:MAG: VWA domain-containing protein, partial [Gammaproteobacteria bacterium]|nr:VWA domain-containing protein [Gammaproteobacteria bacterium]